jgi:hypothetical protein
VGDDDGRGEEEEQPAPEDLDEQARAHLATTAVGWASVARTGTSFADLIARSALSALSGSRAPGGVHRV